jgi:hypothetical protein
MNSECIAIIISVLSIGFAVYSLILARKAINIETTRDKNELEKGKVAFLSLILRYFILNYQRTDFNNGKFNIKTDPFFYNNYVEELDSIASQFDELVNSSFHTVLFKKYPIIGSSSLFIRKEIMFNKLYNAKGNTYGYDHVTWERMFNTFEMLIKETQLEDDKNGPQTIQDLLKYAKSINKIINPK